MRYKPCVFYSETKMMNGEIKTRCKLDGSIRNICKGCPHKKPTLLSRLWRHFTGMEEKA